MHVSENTFFLWLGTMFPLVFSAGPANITMAALGARFGLVKVLPFISGVNLIVLTYGVLIGFGAGQFMEKYPDVFQYMQYAGAAYLFYLAFTFFRLSGAKAKAVEGRVPNFFDGAILQLLNIKVLTVTVVMFSQFLDGDSERSTQVGLLSVGLALLTSCATLFWAAGGAWLTRVFASEKSIRLQGYVFGTMLIGVSFWMLF